MIRVEQWNEDIRESKPSQAAMQALVLHVGTKGGLTNENPPSEFSKTPRHLAQKSAWEGAQVVVTRAVEGAIG